MDQIGERLHAIENGSTKSDLPSSFQHKDLDNLCSKIKNMQNGLEQRKKELVVSTGVYERRDNERDLSRYIRQYFYPYQSYDASLSQKIRQHLKINYLRDVGGDFHDYFNITPNLICFVTGTVSRPKKSISNIQTAIDILMTMSLIRSHFRVYSTLPQLVFNLNNDLYSQNKGKFTVNIFMGVLNCETGILEYFSAGAPTHYMISHRSIFPISVQHGLPLASKENSEVYPIGKRELFSGDMLLVHTDGVLSRQNSTSEKYGQGRLQKIMSTASGSEPANFLEKIVEDITDFSKNQSLQVDDYTLFAIKYRGM
jgi:serine phosphatase RsbU (regulator of sigma subunit)